MVADLEQSRADSAARSKASYDKDIDASRALKQDRQVYKYVFVLLLAFILPLLVVSL